MDGTSSNEKSNARKKKHRASLTECQKADIKSKDAERKRIKRAEEKNTVESNFKTEEKKRKERERKMRYRDAQRNAVAATVKIPFKTKQHRGKVLKALNKALPASPNKRRCAVKQLFQSLSPDSKKHVVTPDRTGKEVSAETKKCVEAFFLDDFNSRVMPGKKDVKSVKLNGEKTKQRKRLLLDDIDTLHKLYNEQFSDNKVGRSKFFELRPVWVIPVQKQSQEVCKCIYHENIDLICAALTNKARYQKLPIQMADLDDFVKVAKLKFSTFNIFSFTKEEVRRSEDFLTQRYLSSAKPILNLNTLHFLQVQEGSICGELSSPACPCHPSEKVIHPSEKIAPNSKEPIIPITGHFYYVTYVFTNQKGGDKSQSLPAICSEISVSATGGYFFSFIRLVASTKDGYIYKVDEDDVASIKPEDINKEIQAPVTIDKTTFSRRQVQYKWSVKL